MRRSKEEAGVSSGEKALGFPGSAAQAPHRHSTKLSVQRKGRLAHKLGQDMALDIMIPSHFQGKSELLKTPTSAKLPGSWPLCHLLSFVSSWPVAVTPHMPSISASLGRRFMAPVSGSWAGCKCTDPGQEVGVGHSVMTLCCQEEVQ